MSFDAAGQRGRLREHGQPGPAHAERRAELDLARHAAADGRRGDRRRGAAVGDARHARPGQLVPAVATRPVMVSLPAAGTQIAPATPIYLTFSKPVSEVLGSARPRLSPSTPGQLARNQQPHARVHSVGLRRAARLPAAHPAAAPGRGDRRRGRRAAQHQPDRMDGAAGLDAAPAAAARPGGLPAGRLAARGRRRRAHAQRARRRPRSNRRAAASAGAIRTRRTSCRRCGAPARRA